MLEARLVPSARRGTDPGLARGDDRGRPKQIKNTIKSTRYDGSTVGYRLSIFKSAGSARRGKEVELRRLDFAKLSRRPCLYCGSTHRIDRVRNDGHYTRENSVSCCAS